MYQEDNIKNVIDFIGTGVIDGKNVEVSFKAGDIKFDREDWGNPKIVIRPLLDKESKFLQIKSINNNDPYKINGKYLVMYKKPRDKRYKEDIRYQTFEGICENFVPTGKCAFSNENNEMLIVDYVDIVQMKPIVV